MSLKDIDITSEKIDNIQIVKLEGSLNKFTSPKVFSFLEELTKKGSVILNLFDVPYISSTGLEMLFNINEFSLLTRNRFVIFNPSMSVNKTIHLHKNNSNLFITTDFEKALNMTTKVGRW